MFLLRDAAPSDLGDIHRIARHLNSVNLPEDMELLRALLATSEGSFADRLPVVERRYVFAVEDLATRRVVGVSMILAQHGSRRAPHIYFDVREEERYSETLDKHFVHQVLRIGYNFKGLTEIGGLVLMPEQRRHPEQLGKSLAYVRFLYMAAHRHVFCDEVVSELMPPLEPDGTSLLWESLGRKFTGLSYQEADRLSQDNKEFIRALFPQEPIYATLLPAHVQELIGQVGPQTRGVEKMLREIGFEYARRIDPFDGGPHFHARLDEVTLMGAVRRVPVDEARDDADDAGAGPARPFLIAREGENAPRFRAVRALVRDGFGDRLRLPVEIRQVLAPEPGAEVLLLPI